jgi:hypothetical protein
MKFGYEEPTSPGPAITTIDCAESLIQVSFFITVNLRSLTPSNMTVVGQNKQMRREEVSFTREQLRSNFL